ncbi:MAG: sigma-54 dependent transcriptional regulator [Gemmatimonadetes bacterium]|nr:sigma-54 dependent transcriptional regulator [Gemmatimonadota bacterium]
MTQRSAHVLLVDDDEAMREALAVLIESWGYRVSTAGDGVVARSEITRASPDVIITDVVLPGMSGLDLLEELERDGVTTPIILITAHGTVGWAVDAMKRGAMDFLTKPVDHDHLKALVERAVEEIELRGSTLDLQRQLEEGRLGHLVGRSAAMAEVFEAVRLLAQKQTSAIILGESGVGKEVVARTIHDLSRRADGPFLAVNTAAIPEGLIESEIFGHEKGAFNGAAQARPGCFEQADGGTLLLDEIGDMPLTLQPRLLRVLEEGRSRRLGGSREIEFDVRVIAATNRDMDELLEERVLREDLFYRLNVFTVTVPPLRDHPEDIALLGQHFIGRFNEKHETDIKGLRPETLELLEAYDWPGNVRELRNVIERATILAQKSWILPSHVPGHLRNDGARVKKVVLPVGTTAAEAERRLIIETLAAVGGNKTEAARHLGVDPKTIYNKLKAYEAAE